MSLDLGTLRIALELDDNLAQGMAKAKAEMAGLSSSAQTEINKVKRTMGDGGASAGGAFAEGFERRVKGALSSLPAVGVPIDDKDVQAKLEYIRSELQGLSKQRIGIDVSDTDAIAKLTYLRAQMDDLRMMSASVQVKADTGAASAEIDRFLAATEVKAEVAGKAAGAKLSSGMATSARTTSPLIVSAIAGGLIAGGPAISAASILLFGGLAAVAASNVGRVQDSFRNLATNVMNDVQGIAEDTAGEFTSMAGDIQHGFDRLEPSIRAALVGVAPELREIVDAFMDGANTAVPAFTRAIQQGQPVVQGLDTLIRDLGSGVAGMMDELTAHSGAEGAVLAQVGQAINVLLPMLGQLAGEGAELGQEVLPVVNTGLHLLADVLHIVGPALPAVVTGLLALKAVKALSGPLDLLSAKLQTVAGNGEKLNGGLAGKGASAVSKMSSALPILGTAVAVVGAAFEGAAQQTDDWATSINAGGTAAAQARSQMQQTADFVQSNSGIGATSMLGAAWDALKGQLTGSGAAASFAAVSLANTSGAAKDQIAQLSPLEKAQQAVTTATNDYSFAVGKYGAGSDQAAAAAGRLSDANTTLTGMQSAVTAATQGASGAAEIMATRLKGIADTASSGTTEVSLLKGALDALTGANVTADQAEIAVTQAVSAATQAIQGKSAALTFTNGQLDLSNDKSAQAGQILMNLADTQNNQIAVMEKQGYTTDQVTAKTDASRQQFIKTAEQLGATAQQAQDLADRYLGIPGEVHTEVTADTYSALVSIQHVNDALAALRDKTITVTTYNKTVSSGPAGIGLASRVPQAAGHIVHAYSGGGFESMPGGIAQIVPPNTWRVIGDRVSDDEAYIPINRSARSLAILERTAERMHVALAGSQSASSAASAPGRVIHDNRTVYATAMDPRTLAKELANQQRDMEFLAGVA